MTSLEPQQRFPLEQLGTTALKLARSAWGAGLIGMVLAAFPAVGIGLIALVGANAFAGKKGTNRPTDELHIRLIFWALVCFTLVRVVLSWRVSGNPILGLLEGTIVWFVYQGALALAGSFQRLALGLVAGLGIAVIQAFVLVWFPPPQPWHVENPARVRLESSPETLKITPLDPSNAWMVRSIGQRGPGSIEYSLELRAARTQPINISIIAPGLPSGRVDLTCAAQPEWRPCRLEAKLPQRAETLVVVGGYNLWKQGDATLELQRDTVRDLDPVSTLTVLSTLPRASGTAFNPNALGAWMAALGALVLVSRMTLPVRLIGVGFATFGVLLSGSRNALIALLAGALFLTVFRRRHRFTWALLAFTVLVLLVQIIPQTIPGIRALQFLADDGNSTSRLEQFRLAFEAFLSNPVFGVGNLYEAMASRWTPALTTPAEGIAHAHNLFLQVAGESGLLGLITLILLLYAVVRGVVGSSTSAVGWAVLITVLALNLVDYFFLYAPVQAAFWFALALSMTERPARKSSSEP